jgi:hypothetical protein
MYSVSVLKQDLEISFDWQEDFVPPMREWLRSHVRQHPCICQGAARKWKSAKRHLIQQEFEANSIALYLEKVWEYILLLSQQSRLFLAAFVRHPNSSFASEVRKQQEDASPEVVQ